MSFLRHLEEQSQNLDDDWRAYAEQHNLAIGPWAFHPYNPLATPVYSLFVLGIMVLVLAPAAVLMFIGTNVAYIFMAVYAGLVVLAIPVVAVYGIRRARRRRALIQQYLAEHPERKYDQ